MIMSSSSASPTKTLPLPCDVVHIVSRSRSLSARVRCLVRSLPSLCILLLGLFCHGTMMVIASGEQPAASGMPGNANNAYHSQHHHGGSNLRGRTDYLLVASRIRQKKKILQSPIGNVASKTNGRMRRRVQRDRRGDPPDPAQDGGGGGGLWGDDNGNNDNGNAVGNGNENENNPNTSAGGSGGSGGNSYGGYGSYMTGNTGNGSGNGNSGGNAGYNDNNNNNNNNNQDETTYTNNAGSNGGGSYSAYGSTGGNDSFGTNSGVGTSNSYGGSTSYGSGGTSTFGDNNSYSNAGSSYGTGSYGTDGYSSGSSWGADGGNSYGTDGYSSAWGTGAASSQSSPGLKGTLQDFRLPSVTVSIVPAIFFLLLCSLVGMLLTAHKMEHAPEGTYANCCRVSLHTVSCIYKVIYNLYHCRLGDIPQVVFASELEEDEEYTDEEIERMQLRPGIERALDVEHRKALRKVGIEMNKIAIPNSMKKKGKKKGSVQSQSAGNIER